LACPPGEQRRGIEHYVEDSHGVDRLFVAVKISTPEKNQRVLAVICREIVLFAPRTGYGSGARALVRLEQVRITDSDIGHMTCLRCSRSRSASSISRVHSSRERAYGRTFTGE
jgi:hypothetical protein